MLLTINIIYVEDIYIPIINLQSFIVYIMSRYILRNASIVLSA